jgi:hypothetical protein
MPSLECLEEDVPRCANPLDRFERERGDPGPEQRKVVEAFTSDTAEISR